jgi:hypothetical protein
MQNNINSDELRSLQIPKPPLSVQRRIMERVDVGRGAIARERESIARVQSEATTEVEAMILGAKSGAVKVGNARSSQGVSSARGR